MEDGSERAATRLRNAAPRIVASWARRCREQLEAAKDTDGPALIDHVPEVVAQLAAALATASPDRYLVDHPLDLAAHHGRERATPPNHSLDQIVAEYQLLRRVIVETLDEEGPTDASTRDVVADAMLAAVRASATELVRPPAGFCHMVEAVEDYAIFTVSPDGHITSWNDGCARMKRYTADQAIGRHVSMLYPEEGRRRDEPMGHLRTAAIEGRFRGEGMRVRKNGELFLADVSITAIYDAAQQVTGFTKVVQDLTERHALIQERDLSRTDAVQLRATVEQRERFVAGLSHDLRSPLTAARLSAEMIAHAPYDGEQVRTRANRIAGSLSRVDRMIADLVDATRLHAANPLALHFEDCDLGQIAVKTCADLAPRHGDRFRVEIDGSPLGSWNADGLNRVVENLLSNAIKYGEEGRPITVRIRRVDDRVLLSVHNYGTIIPIEEQPASSGKPGWGIRLALVMGIVEAHGGIVKAESYPREGTTFTADLPVVATAPSS